MGGLDILLAAVGFVMHEAALFAAVGFVLLGMSDLLVDLIWLALRLVRIGRPARGGGGAPRTARGLRSRLG